MPLNLPAPSADSRTPLRRFPSFLLCALAGLALAMVGCHSPSETAEHPTGVVITPSTATPGQASQSSSKPPPATIATPGSMGPQTTRITSEPDVRIRILKSARTVNITCPSGARIGPSDAMNRARLFGTSVRITLASNGYNILNPNGSGLAWPVASLTIQSNSGQPVIVNGTPYPDSIQLNTLDDSSFDVINRTALESYLPGVIFKELLPDWQPQTFRAQAVAARSFAIYQITLNAKHPFDMESGVEDQAYMGDVKRSKAVEAVQATRGLVLSYKDLVLPAFFSSSSGGVGQDASAIFPGGADILPLNGRDQTSVEPLDAHKNHWTLTRDRRQLAKRISEWGKHNHHPVANLADLQSIAITGRNAPGRPGEFTLASRTGERYTLRAEEFRFACNMQVAGLPTLSFSEKLESSFVDVRLDGPNVHFTGHGFGHGVGMSQHGAEILALRGASFQQILAYYYRGADLVKLY